MVTITIDNKSVDVPEHSTIIQACDKLSIEIPRFCYHERLSISGNCRMCLVEVEKAPKPVASCTQPVMDGMVVKTNSKMVKEAREGVMEFLLIHHPLDCPICDQAGECDLQDQSLFYGRSHSRYKEKKRSVKDKNMGPLIQTNMTRCIHCTRCVRFLEEVAGTNELGAISRGEDMQITTYVEKAITSELSGNIIDLCPVGALTSKPYAFTARSWELKNTYSIDIMDAVGSHIRIDSKHNEVMRILPNLCEEINEEWISDKARFFYDALKLRRLDMPIMVTEKHNDNHKNPGLREISYEEAFSMVNSKISQMNGSYDKVGMISGKLSSIEAMFSAKAFMKKIFNNTNYDCRENMSLLGSKSDTYFDDQKHSSSYIFNSRISNLKNADACILIGSNPRKTAPILNAHIRKAYLKNHMDIFSIGIQGDLTYPHSNLGNSPWILKQIAEGAHPICKELKKKKKLILIIDDNLFSNDNCVAFQYYIDLIVKKYNVVTPDWNGYNILSSSAARVGGLHIDFVPDDIKNGTYNILKKSKLLFLLAADDIDFSLIPKSTFVVYIGSHGESGAARANLIIPSPTFTEQDGIYVNFEGRVQNAYMAVPAIDSVISEWKLFDKLTEYISGEALGFKDLNSLRDIIYQEHPILKNDSSKKDIYNHKYKLENFKSDILVHHEEDIYQSNILARCSKILQTIETS